MDPKFRRRLRAQGFYSYSEYLKSPHWHHVKTEFRSSDRPQDCYCCGDTENVHLHHKTYERVCEELLDDLVPLCSRCHALVHVLERRGDLGIDLVGLLDQVRAKQYVQQQKPTVERAHLDYEATHLKNEEKQLVQSCCVLLKGAVWHWEHDRRDKAAADLQEAQDLLQQLIELTRRLKELEAQQIVVAPVSRPVRLKGRSVPYIPPQRLIPR